MVLKFQNDTERERERERVDCILIRVAGMQQSVNCI